ncbi:mechanosensitive ion channel domain-containing protein, partial [uncultured Thiodictyon sp.]|uniref:mechanosensitive ion channel domain-containing protein n=1 Tax=uncultured Thiodictyon sp. TaxID=1846217 RepID=UPI0025DD8B51
RAAAASATAGGRGAARDGEATDAPPPVEEPEPDLAILDEQTRKLLHASIFILAVLGLWWLWSPTLPALNIFRKIVLWHSATTVDGVQQLVPVTAADAGLVVIILSVALIAAKNLPALIEILLLRRSSVNAGTRYAVRTLVSYAITAIAILTAFGALGLRWSQVQWLVAGMSVGIGFGLQEIVANFISGIIILFERPVRVGDTVTIGGVTGIVTKIEIRATTIRNWDRQELIVPNKEFITGRLLNWTLTDQLNRIVITVGIEYGSDARLALTLLTETAAANPRVLKDPPPLATLDAFGDNALTLVLRCYLETMEIRQGVTTEMHLAIEQAFREHGIGIAFPQREINISARDTIDVRLHRVEPPDHQPPPGPP